MFVKQLTAVYEKFLNKTQTDFWLVDLRESVQEYLCNRGSTVCNRTADYQMFLNDTGTTTKSQKFGLCGALLNATHDQWYEVTKDFENSWKNLSHCDRQFVMKMLADCTTNKQVFNT